MDKNSILNYVLKDSYDITKIQQKNILLVGVGGLGCEMLKNLLLLGIQNIHILDFDKIEVTNCNRQIFYKKEDINEYKVEVAKRFIEKRWREVKVTGHSCRLEKKPLEFFNKFDFIISALDSVESRQYLNFVCFQICLPNFNTKLLNLHATPPLFDGGVGGYNGQARILVPYKTSCYNCTLGLLTLQSSDIPSCTLRSSIKTANDCILYSAQELDGESLIEIYNMACSIARQKNISGVTYELTETIVKKIEPAILSTNSVIAGLMTTQILDYFSNENNALLRPYHMYVGEFGCYMEKINIEPLEDCVLCHNLQIYVELDSKKPLLHQLITELNKHKIVPSSIMTQDGVLYMHSIHRSSISEKTFADYGLDSRFPLFVNDSNKSKTVFVYIKTI